MDPLAVARQWSMVQLMHPHHNRLSVVFRSLFPRLWVCTSSTPMSLMHSSKQIIPSRSITCAAIKFSKIGGRHGTYSTPPPDAVVPVLKNLQGRPEDPRLWSIRCHAFLITLKFKNNTHAPCLYHGIFNGEFFLLLHMIKDFSIACKLE
jgi:hypothetical protein